jgi:sec-independent protein translocase protein TatA
MGAHEEVIMPFNIGGPELVFVLVIVLIVFGAGKLPTVFGQLGKGVRTFREEAQNDEVKPVSATTAGGTATAAGKFCSSCGKPNADGAKFCASCGTPLAA